jgi:Uma2 family endonuclease
MKLADLDLNKRYSYADYLGWDLKERVELIMGKLFKMSPAPTSRHQILSMDISGQLWAFLKRQDCRVYTAPFDVRLPTKSTDDKDITTIVQPDISVICDRSKVDARGCIGAPDVVVEILSPSNNVVELNNKFDIYEAAGVKEYWIVSPQDNSFTVNTLTNGKYVTSRALAAGKVFTSSVLPGFSLDLKALFELD